MKKWIFIVLISIIVSIQLYSQSPKPRILGVVMGISKYQNVPSLRYADRDAMSFYNFLLSPAGGGADTNNIRLLLNEKATSYNFFEAMDNLLDMAKEGDQVYIYFAGHGDIEKKTGRQNGFLIGYNAPANCYAAGGCIGVRYLQDYVETLVTNNKSKVTMIIDACRSGKLAGGSQGAEITALALQAEWKGVTKILSCQPGETSLEGDQWGGGSGVFTYFMLKGMLGQADKDGDGIVSVMELNNFLDENVLRETNKKQLPEIVGDRRQDIVKVDKKHALAMLNQMERPIFLPPEKQSAGFEADVSSINDISVLKEYEKFKYYINNNNLIAYNDTDSTKETALSIYRSLENSRTAQPIITKMKRELLAVLQNRSQIRINEWLSGIEHNSDSITGEKTIKDLKTAFDMVDSTYLHYNQIKYRYLFWSSFDEKDDKKIINILNECIKTEPNEPFAHLNIGICYTRQKNYEKALYHTDKAIELSKKWAWPFLNKGGIYIDLGKNEEAIKYFNKALEIMPNDYKIWLGKGIALRNSGKTEEAIKCFNSAIELAPDSIAGWKNKGLALYKKNCFEDALICFDKITKLEPDNFEAWLNKGAMLNKLNRKEEAIKCYDKTIEFNPKLAIAWNNKGVSLSEINKYEESIACFNKSIELNPVGFVGWRCKGLSLYELGKYEEAVNNFDKAIELGDTEIDPWFYKGLALANLKQYQEAIIFYGKAIEIKPDFHYALYNKACSYSLLKNKEEMLKSLKKAIELNKKYKVDATKDNDFKEYWNDPDFLELVK